ncbi:hypothetical protein KY284_037802 [Solanum tuberosum]|nr:hypothetical protein KY284_037802 [Solanum tuberosum]
MDDFHKRLASLKSVLTCGICKKLCKDVTIIEECCHRFCKKCITRKISKGKWNVCPECSMDLGVAPLHKLRPDHQLQGIRDIFSIMTNHIADLNIKGTNQPESSSIPLLSGKATQHKQQVESIAYAAESSKKNKSIEPLYGINDVWEPLNKLVTKGDTLDNSEEPVPKFISSTPQFNLDDYENEEDNDDVEEDDEYVPSPTVKEHKVRQQNVVKKLDAVQSIEAPSSSNNNNTDKGKGKKGRRGRKKKETNNPLSPPPVSSGGDGDGGGGTNLNVAQVEAAIEIEGGTISGSTRVVNERVHPIWFTLVACDKQEGPSPLPQISTRYIKIKDANKPSSYIKKYLAHKLSLQSEDEVELRMLGMPIRPDLPIKDLEKLWLRVSPHSGKSSVKVGSSAEELVMVLKYSRSHPKLN